MALSSVSTLLKTFGDAVWRADALAVAASAEGAALPSGHSALDAQLPGGGWPVGALCEILQPPHSQSEWRLLLPALRTLPHHVVLVGAPSVPFGPGLAAQGLDVRAVLWVQAQAVAQRLWATEQALRCAGVAAVLAWLPQVRSDHLRRLHLAAQAHGKLLWVLRPQTAQNESSPAVLRLLVGQGADDALAVEVLKRRGPPLALTLRLPARHATLAALLALGGGQRASAPAAPAVVAPARVMRWLDQPQGAPKERDHALDRFATAA